MKTKIVDATGTDSLEGYVVVDEQGNQLAWCNDESDAREVVAMYAAEEEVGGDQPDTP